MEKNIVIDGKDISFKSDGAIPLRYKLQFGRDFFSDLAKIEIKGKNINAGTIDTEVFYNLAWLFAKTADNSIPTIIEWLGSFDSFPIMEIIPELQEMLINLLATKKK